MVSAEKVSTKVATGALTLVLLGASACGDDRPSLTTAADDATQSTAVASTGSATSPPSASPSPEDFDVAAAEAYCTDQGGALVPRVATWNTNADSAAWLQLAGAMTFCEFESDEESPTRIAVDLVTLYSETPTIAALAYLSEIGPSVPETPSANPATFSCRTDLAGTAEFGNTVAVGGWVNTDEPVFSVMSMCVFPDFSAIDEFGLFYHAGGTVRGADLAPILRYQPGPRMPAMFEETR